jgi:transposase
LSEWCLKSGVLKALNKVCYNTSMLPKKYSSRKFERECARNVKLQWLLSGQQPNYNPIADFLKQNPEASKNTFNVYVLFLNDVELIGGETVAIDGTKIRASNSKNNNCNSKKIDLPEWSS